LGDYLGVFDGGRLVAMAGERFRLPGHTEVSAVCTHPDGRGRGLASALVARLVAGIESRGEQAIMHAARANSPAVRLYTHLGFERRRDFDFSVYEAPA
jgi:predicted GNAT family acetyltransferase